MFHVSSGQLCHCGHGRSGVKMASRRSRYKWFSYSYLPSIPFVFCSSLIITQLDMFMQMRGCCRHIMAYLVQSYTVTLNMSLNRSAETSQCKTASHTSYIICKVMSEFTVLYCPFWRENNDKLNENYNSYKIGLGLHTFSNLNLETIYILLLTVA